MNRLAARTATGVIAGIVAATAIATGVGFWLSYAGLHSFALRAGLHGAEAWAWPGSVDLFILAGEAGVTISALRRAEDWQAWAYLAIGFAASVTANVLHVDPSALHWTRYAVAAVPPVAAMLALAALLRQVYRLADHASPSPHPAMTTLTQIAPADSEHAARLALAASLAAGNPISQRQIMTRFGLTRTAERRVRQAVLAGSNGHG